MTTLAFSVSALDHVQWSIPPGTLPRARAFYEGLLGLREARHPALDRPGTLRLWVGAQRLDLSEGSTLPESSGAHLALRVSPLQSLVVVLREAGHEVIESPLPSGEARIYVDDPFGHRLEFIEPLPAPSAREGDRHVAETQLAR